MLSLPNSEIIITLTFFFSNNNVDHFPLYCTVQMRLCAFTETSAPAVLLLVRFEK